MDLFEMYATYTVTVRFLTKAKDMDFAKYKAKLIVNEKSYFELDIINEEWKDFKGHKAEILSI